MVRIDFQHRFNLLFDGIHHHGCITKFTRTANAIDGIFMGNIDRAKTIKNILGVYNCLYTGKYLLISTFKFLLQINLLFNIRSFKRWLF